MASVYVSKNPNLVLKGMNAVKGVANKPMKSLDDSYKVYSKKLGRYLTDDELKSKGLL